MKEIFVVFLIVNAIFWGLMPHSLHCQLVAKFTSMQCPPHIVHILFGITCFILAAILSQDEYATEIYKTLQSLSQKTVKVVQTAGKLGSVALDAARKNFTSIEDFSNKVDSLMQGKNIQIKLR
jgi:hypothetical protein